MPILDPGDPEFAGFDIDQPFQSVLHSPQIISGGKVSAFYRDLVENTSLDQQWKNFSRMARIGTGNIAITSGLPLDRLGALATLFAEVPRVSGDQLEQVVKEAVITGALLAVDEALEVVATKVPILGWVVEIGLFFYRIIKNAVTSAKTAPPKAQAKALAYDKNADQDVTRLLLAELKKVNWTKLFLPQQKPSDVCITTLAYTVRGDVDGYAWEVCKPFSDRWGWGLTPGLSSEFTGFVGAYQSPRKLRGSTRDAGVESITPFGNLHPSVVQLGMTIWQMCLKNSPNAFRIDGDAIVSAWHDNYGEMFDFAYNRTSDEWLRKQIITSCQWYEPAATEYVSDVSRVQNPKTGEPWRPEDLPNKYTQSNLWWYSELMAYYVEQVWKPRLPGFLETLTVAYVPPGAPALKADSNLKQKYEEMRSLLLDHKARYEVELDLIPDAPYRNAMYQATLTPPPVITAQPKKYPKFKWLDYVPPVDPELPPPQEPDTDPGPGVTPGDKDATASGVLALLGVGAGVGLAVALARR